jgi:serine/threonine protein kinase
VLEIFRQVCAGAAYAQDRGIVHRDIKPDNIFLRSDGTAVLGDFGICFVDDEGTRLTMTDEVAGSRFYCAPELRDGRLESHVLPTAADVYSLGKVLYWMLSGGQIFDREEHRENKYRIGQHDPLNPAYELVNQLLDAAIVQDWSNRIGTASKLLAKVEDMMSIVAAGGHALALSAPHRCMFCARGAYKVAVDMTKRCR